MAKEALTCLVGVIFHWVSLSLRSLVDIPPTLPWVPNFHSRVGKGARECTLPKDRHFSAAHGQPRGTADPAHHSMIVPILPPQQGAGAQALLCVSLCLAASSFSFKTNEDFCHSTPCTYIPLPKLRIVGLSHNGRQGIERKNQCQPLLIILAK